MTIDWWTLLLQTVNVLILVWILGRFLFRPVAEIVEKRQAAAKALLSDAEAKRDKARAELAEIADIRNGFAEEHEKIVLDAHKAAEAEKARLMDEARAEAERAQAASRVTLEHERAETERRLTERASELAVDIAKRLVSTLPPDAATAALIASLRDAIADLPEERRDVFAAAAAREQGVTVISASPLSEAEKSQCEDTLADALGVKASVGFETDPRLIAGVEVRGGDVILRRTWRNDLDHILEELRG